MAAPKQNSKAPEGADLATPKPPKWKATTKFVEYRGRRITIKLVDEENGFDPARTAMTINGPAAISHAHALSIDKDGYIPKSAAEERALLKLAQKPTVQSKNGSLLVLWEDREMPEDQRKAELSAADYRKRVAELEDQIADQPAILEENRKQAAQIEALEKQLAAKQGG